MQGVADPSSGLNQTEVRRRHILAKALMVGLASGVVASAFRAALAAIETMRLQVHASVSRASWIFFSVGLPTASEARLSGAVVVWHVP